LAGTSFHTDGDETKAKQLTFKQLQGEYITLVTRVFQLFSLPVFLAETSLGLWLLLKGTY
jgi:hypothetical protein